MRRASTVLMVLAALCVASTALALDPTPRTGTPPGGSVPFSLNTILFCDNAIQNNAFFQNDTDRYGNKFNFGLNGVLSNIEFAHFGFGFAGPYSYDIELWDPASCTVISTVNGLVAGDAANATRVEQVNVCANNLVASGDVIVAIDANSCLVPNDCYPDLWFDSQIGVVCPYIVQGGVTCTDISGQAGPFLLRIDINNCGTPTMPSTWGGLKQIYR